MVQIKLKRVYDEYQDSDGLRILVDRLWPRGIKKEQLHYDMWEKGVTPSTDLRKWFHTDKNTRWHDFVLLYKQELNNSKELMSFIDKIKKQSVITLLYASKDKEHNHALILKDVLEEKLDKIE